MSMLSCRDEDHEDAANYNFDHPDALDFDLAYEKLNELIDGKDVDIPVYDFALHKRIAQTNRIKTAPIIIFEGIHAISESRFRELMDLKIFVLTPDDIRLKRRIKRDIAERGRTVVEVLQQYNRFVKPAYDDFIKPTMKYADVIVPFWDRNENAIEMLVENLKIKLSKFKIGLQALQSDMSGDDLLSPATNEVKKALQSKNDDKSEMKAGLSLPSKET